MKICTVTALKIANAYVSFEVIFAKLFITDSVF